MRTKGLSLKLAEEFKVCVPRWLTSAARLLTRCVLAVPLTALPPVHEPKSLPLVVARNARTGRDAQSAFICNTDGCDTNDLFVEACRVVSDGPRNKRSSLNVNNRWTVRGQPDLFSISRSYT
ncbi:unnamed protein product [Ectocarpus sp. 12 AP-2014]